MSEGGRRPSKVDAADLLVLDAGRDKCDAKCKAGILGVG